MSEETSTAVSVRMQELSPAYAEIAVLARTFAMSGYFQDAQDAAKAVTKIIYGRELGLSPIVSMSSIHIIEGKPAMSSNLMAALIKRSGKYDYRVLRSDNEACVLAFKEKTVKGWEEVGESSFTIDDAKRAGVAARGVWVKYAKAMLFARAISQGLRTYCPDASLAPLYVPEELGATVNEDGNVTELPKSARVAEVTQEAEAIQPPKKTAAVVESRASTWTEGKQVTGANDSNVYPQTVAEPNEDEIPPNPPKAVVTEEAEAVAPPKRGPGRPRKDSPPEDTAIVGGQQSGKPAEVPAAKPTVPEGSVSVEQAVNFERMFKKSLRSDLEKQATALSHDWLRLKGFVNSDGEPTAKAIPAKDFYEIREAAIAHAEAL